MCISTFRLEKSCATNGKVATIVGERDVQVFRVVIVQHADFSVSGVKKKTGSGSHEETGIELV